MENFRKSYLSGRRYFKKSSKMPRSVTCFIHEMSLTLDCSSKLNIFLSKIHTFHPPSLCRDLFSSPPRGTYTISLACTSCLSSMALSERFFASLI
mmetsp:Transcript_1550/g.3709  ORF Transcript_1550/g.3709 Transcript_1550/m.3709 type:complete len:95 (+) Transcript_1550:38-322(+)